MSDLVLTKNASKPSAPPAGTASIYVKNDGLYYTQNESGTETPLRGPIGDTGGTGATGATGPAGPNFDVTGTLASPTSISNAGTIAIIAASKRQRSYVAGSGGAVTAAVANPDTVGQEWWIIGSHDTNTVSIVNATNIILNGNKTLARGSILKLIALDINTWAEAGYNGI